MREAVYPLTVKIMEIRGELTKDNDWHYVWDSGGAEGAFCTGQVFRSGDEDTKYETRVGKVTCKDCITLIRKIKKVRQ